MGTCAEKSVARGRELSFSFAVRPHFWVSLGDEFIAASTAKKNCSRQYDEGQFVALFEASFGSVRLNETMAKRVRFFLGVGRRHCTRAVTFLGHGETLIERKDVKWAVAFECGMFF